MPPALPLSFAAPAKINLYLHVTGKRDDGYHLLDSLVAFADCHDTLTFEPSASVSMTNQGPFGEGLPASADNLVIKAALQLRERTGLSDGVHITLTKRLPVASGIGGGSADAAAAIKGLVRFWNLHPGHHGLSGLALGLGADVPICLFGNAAYMGGIGEQIDPLPALPETPLVLVNPGIGVSTPAIFKARSGAFSQTSRFEEEPATSEDLVHLLKAGRRNDLTEPAVALQPVIGDVLDAIADTDNCLLARMSGSGATCFGLYTKPAEARAAAERLQGAHPGWWVQAGTLISDTQRLTPQQE